MPETTCSHRQQVDRWVIEPYRGKRTFYHANEHFLHARERFYAVAQRQRPESVLDVGCGHAMDAEALRGLVTRYVGVDPVEANLVQARIDNPGGDFRLGFMQKLPFDDASFDWVWVSNVWEILPSVEDMRVGLEEALRVARHKVFSLEPAARPRFLTERYMMVPMEYGVSIRRVNYNPDKRKADYLWEISKDGISPLRKGTP